MPGTIQLGAEIEHEVRVGRAREFRRRVVGLEGLEDFRRVIYEIQHVGRVLARVRPVQPRKRLHRLDARQPLVDIHPAQERLIEAGLEFVRHQQDLILVALERFANVAALQIGIERLAVLREAVRTGLLVVHFSGEGHQRADLVAVVLDVFVDGQLPAHGLDAAADHDHCLGLAVQQRRHVGAEVLDDDLDCLGDVVGVQPHPAHDPLQGRAALDFRFIEFLAVMGQFESQLVGRVVLQHVEDELLLDGLSHRIDVKRCRHIVTRRLARGIGARTEQFHCFVFRCRREGHEGDAANDGETPKLEPITEAGSGSLQDKEKAYLSEIIEKVNDLFEGDLSDQDKLVYVNNVIKGKLLESETLRQQAVNNTKEQFANSPDLKTELLNAIMGALDAHNSLSTQALNSDTVQRGIKDVLLNNAGLYESLRDKGAG